MAGFLKVRLLSGLVVAICNPFLLTENTHISRKESADNGDQTYSYISLTGVVAGYECKGSPSGVVVACCSPSFLIKNFTPGNFPRCDDGDEMTIPTFL